MEILLENWYGLDRHEIVEDVQDDFEYAGEDVHKGVWYTCYFVPDGISYRTVCVRQKGDQKHDKK